MCRRRGSPFAMASQHRVNAFGATAFGNSVNILTPHRSLHTHTPAHKNPRFWRHEYYMCITRHTAPTNRMQKWYVRFIHRSLHSLNNHHHHRLTLASCVDLAFRGAPASVHFRPKQTVKAKGFSVLQIWADWLPCRTRIVCRIHRLRDAQVVLLDKSTMSSSSPSSYTL